MTISGFLFIFVFLPVALTIYYLVSESAKEYVLLLISLLFYSFCSINYLVLFIISISITVFLGRSIDHCERVLLRRIILIIGICYNIGILFTYKYYDFSISTLNSVFSANMELKNYLLPVGISFYTFKAVSYLVDVYKKTAVLVENPVHDALYLSIFSQIQSGPITRYNDLKRMENPAFSAFSNGVFRFITGFGKKNLIANIIGNITSEVFSANISEISTPYIWLGSICFSLQLYFDFSGYTDMAIGLSQMFGYQCTENFDHPYTTESVTHFWRRWHISLSTWFRDYIYIPMGGSRNNSSWKVYFNLFIVWIITGLWHGAAWNYLIWGLGYFFAISFERITSLPKHLKTGLSKTLYRIVTLIFINFQWVLFRSDGIINGMRYIKRMIIPHSEHAANIRTIYLLKNYWVILVIAVLLCTNIDKRIRSVFAAKSELYDLVIKVVVTAAFIISLAFAVAGQNNPFIYTIF